MLRRLFETFKAIKQINAQDPNENLKNFLDNSSLHKRIKKQKRKNTKHRR